MKQSHRFSAIAIYALAFWIGSYELARAQNYEDYYNNKIKAIKACKGDLNCVERIKQKSRRNAQKILNDPSVISGNTSRTTGDLDKEQDDLDELISKMSPEEIENKLKDAKLFRELKQSRASLESFSRCGIHRRKAAETKAELDRLNTIRNKTTENYARQAQDVKDANTKALKDYERCYEQQLPDYPILKAEGILTVNAHYSVYQDREPRYKGITDLDEYISKLEAALKGAIPSDVVGVLTHVHRRVEVLPGGRGQRWRRVSKGYEIRPRDELRTGPRGRARIAFADRYKEKNAGPTVVNVGSGSHVRMEKFLVSLKDPPKRTGIIGLLKGTLRAFTKNWGPRSSFRVRMGATICGIRGTEVAISYDPNKKVAADQTTFDVHLSHGDAYVQGPLIGKVDLAPKTSRTVLLTPYGADISNARRLDDAKWNTIVRSTGNGKTETLSTANQSYSELLTVGQPPETFTHGNTLNSNQKDHSRRAENIVDDYLRAMQNNRPDIVRSLLTDEKKKSMASHKTSRGYQKFLDQKGQRPRDYTVKCSACGPGFCKVLAYVDMESNFPGRGSNVLFVLKEQAGYIPGGKYLVSATSTNQQDISSFMLASPVCRK